MESDYLCLRNSSSSLQVCFNFIYQVKTQGLGLRYDGLQTNIGHPFMVDIALFNDAQAIYNHLSPMLSRLGISSCHHQILVSEIVQQVGKTTRNGLSKDCQVLPLIIKVVLQRKLSKRMVPTVPMSVILKCVNFNETGNGDGAEEAGQERKRKRVDGSQVCSICLEELVNFGVGMLCGHLFHGKCIFKWLEKSHSCPYCRFQMETQT